MGIYRGAWRVVCAVCVAVGVVVAVVVLPIEAWVLTATLAVAVALIVVLGFEPSGDRTRVHPVMHALRLVGIGWLVAVAVLSGGILLGSGVLLPVVVLAGTSPWAVRWYAHVIPGRPVQSADQPIDVSTELLCRQWRESYYALTEATSGNARLRIVMARQRCLDELERRDPDGLHAWLASTASAGGDPSRFLSEPGSDR